MVLLTNLPNKVAADAHHQGNGKQPRQCRPRVTVFGYYWTYLHNQGIEDAEYKKAFYKPHVGYLHLDRCNCQYNSHQQQWNSETQNLLGDKSAESLPFITARDEIAGDEEIQSHEEGGIGGEKMPNPRHCLSWIRRVISPLTSIAISLSCMVKYNQKR